MDDYKKISKITYKNQKKNILINFHWRKGNIDTDVNEFKKSQYFREINKLINNQKLKELYDEKH